MKQIIYSNQKVITTELLAQAYETDPGNVRSNFNNHKGNFQEGKHYFLLTGNELRMFKRDMNNIDVAAPNVNQLYLWTERGANRHCKILDTDRAWEQFDNLEETYFQNKSDRALKDSPGNVIKYLSGLASYLRVQSTIMRNRGCSSEEIAIMDKMTCDYFGVPTPTSLSQPNAFGQLCFSDLSNTAIGNGNQ